MILILGQDKSAPDLIAKASMVLVVSGDQCKVVKDRHHTYDGENPFPLSTLGNYLEEWCKKNKK